MQHKVKYFQYFLSNTNDIPKKKIITIRYFAFYRHVNFETDLNESVAVARFFESTRKSFKESNDYAFSVWYSQYPSITTFTVKSNFWSWLLYLYYIRSANETGGSILRGDISDIFAPTERLCYRSLHKPAHIVS